MGIVKIVLFYALTIYFVLLIGRLILSWIQAFSRPPDRWQPKGIVLILAEAGLYCHRPATEIAKTRHPHGPDR